MYAFDYGASILLKNEISVLLVYFFLPFFIKNVTEIVLIIILFYNDRC